MSNNYEQNNQNKYNNSYDESENSKNSQNKQNSQNQNKNQSNNREQELLIGCIIFQGLPQGSPIYIFSESIYNNFICAIIDD